MTIPHRPPLLTPATGHSPEAAGGLGFDLIQRIVPIATRGGTCRGVITGE